MSDRVDTTTREAALSPGRRRFVRWLGLGGVAGLFAGALGGLGAGEARGQAAPPPPTAPPTPPAAPAAPSDEAKALHSILTGRYGKSLDAAQSQSLLEALEQTVQSGKALRARTLANSVEPDTVFGAVTANRGDGGGR